MIKKQAIDISWQEVELEKIAKSISAGGTPRRDKKEYWENGTIPWLKISDMKSAHVSKTEENITEEGLKNSSTKLFPRGTLVYSIFATLGAIGILEKELTTNQAIAGIIPKKEIILTKYLYYCLISERDKIVAKGSHATQDNLNLTILRSHKIPLPFRNGKPDLEEQQRIVAILEKAERLKEQGKMANELLDEYLKSVFYEMFWNKGFEDAEIGLISEILSRGRSPSYVSISNLRIINQKCIYWESIKLDNVKYQDEKIRNSSFILKRGDVLINSTGTGTLGRAAVFNEEGKFTIDSHVTLLRPTEKLSSDYFTFYLKTEKGQEELYAKCVSGSTNQIELSRSKFAKLKIPLPPLALQQKFASIVEKVEEMKENVKKTQVNTEDLFNSLMQKAFRGEL